MKRIHAVSMILALSISLAACGGGSISESENAGGPAETFSYPIFSRRFRRIRSGPARLM